MRISDWSSDVCSSDLWRQTVAGVRAEFAPAPKFLAVKTPLTLDLRAARGGVQSVELRLAQGQSRVTLAQQSFVGAASDAQRLQLTVDEHGRASGRERVCQYV